jgi:hypothetical protein
MRHVRTRMRSTRFLLVGAAIVVVALLSAGGYAYANNPTPNVYTACLTTGGQGNTAIGSINKIAIGTKPSSPCSGGQVQISWNQTGPQGESVTPASLPVGDAHCATGGSSFTVGGLTTYACNGTNGKDGSNGSNGTNGFNSLTKTTSEPAGANCANGGQKIETGLDDGDGGGTANDGILQSGEVDSTSYVCNGANGTNGTIAAQSCGDPGSSVTGIDGSGKLICSCPTNSLTWATDDITASVVNGTQQWPDQQDVLKDPNNSACTITLQTPYNTKSGSNYTAIINFTDNTIQGFTPHGWSVVTSTGYPSGTQFTIHVGTPNCLTAAGIGSVQTASDGSPFPACSNGDNDASSGLSTDHVSVTVN